MRAGFGTSGGKDCKNFKKKKICGVEIGKFGYKEEGERTMLEYGLMGQNLLTRKYLT